jgi:hypothetical protein
VDINASVLKEYSLFPKQFVHTVTIGLPFPIWYRNRGGIMAAEGALGRALEEPHRVEDNLTTALGTVYMSYKQNLDALEYYRRFILPDQVLYYRGVVDRRQIDQTGVMFSDLVTAQQTLVTNVSTYLTTLGSLWSSVVSVADLLQTDDLFQLGQPRPVPALPDLESLPPWPCCHECPPAGVAQPSGHCVSTPVPVSKAAPSCVSQDYFRVARPEHDVKGVRTANTPFDDSGRVTHPTNNSKLGTNGILSDSDPKRAEAPTPDQSRRWLSPHVLSREMRKPGYVDDHLLDEPPPVPLVLDKKQAGSINQN